MFVRTKRLFLRPAWQDDLAVLGRALSDPQYARDLSGTPWLETMADPETYLSAARGPHDANLLIFKRTDGAPRLLGAVGFAAWTAAPEFGIWLMPEARRHGFAIEAARAALSIAFDGLRLPELVATAVASGHPAARLLCRLGFRKKDRSSLFASLARENWSCRLAEAA